MLPFTLDLRRERRPQRTINEKLELLHYNLNY